MALDRDLLFAVTALDRGLLGADEILALGPELTSHPDRSLADLLVRRGRLSSEIRAQLEAQVDARLSRPSGEHPTRLVEPDLDDSTIEFPGLSQVLDSTRGWTAGPVGEASDSTVDGEATTQPDVETPASESWIGALADPPPSRNRYRRGRRLARGGMGEIWLVRDEHLGRDVILKIVRTDRRSGVLTDRFLREARIAGRLEHPNIVTVHEVAGDGADATPFYTMRHVRGRTLTHAIHAYHNGRAGGSTGRVELVGLLEAFVTVCRAVAFAHRHGVAHRDLKPSNVILGDFGEVIVLDWGLVKLRGVSKDREAEALSFLDLGTALDETLDGAILGTPPYMAPEQARGEHHRIGEGSDVYSLGVILYEILTAHRPFPGPGARDYLRQICEDEPTPPRQHDPAVPPALAAVCLKAMARDPAARYATASDLADEVRRWLADEPVSAYREPWPTRLRRSARRHRTLVTSLAVLLATGVLALAVGYVLLRGEQARTAAQRDLARTEGLRATRERVKAEAARDEATKASQLYGTAIVDLLKTASDEKLDRLAESEQIRQEIATVAVGTSRELLRSRPTDPVLRAGMARIERMSANLYRMTGQFDEASHGYGEAHRLLVDLVADRPDDAEARQSLAEILMERSDLAFLRGIPQDALPHAREALGQIDQLLKRQPDDPDFLRSQARGLNTVAAALLETGRPDEALQARAAELMKARLDADLAQIKATGKAPRAFGTDYLRRIMYLTNLAELRRRTDRLPQALEAAEEAIRHAEQLRKMTRDDKNACYLEASARRELGYILARIGGRDAAAEEQFGRAIAELERLAKEFKSTPSYRKRLASALLARARWRLAVGPIPAAVEDLTRAERLGRELIGESPEIFGYHSLLASALGQLGRIALGRGDPAAEGLLEEAIREHSIVLDVNPESPEDLQERRHDRELLDLHRRLGSPH